MRGDVNAIAANEIVEFKKYRRFNFKVVLKDPKSSQ